MIDDGNAIGEAFDFGEGVGGEENGSGAGLKYLRFEKAAELGGGDDVDAAGGLVQEEYARTMEESAGEAEALNGAGRKGADLAIEEFAKGELGGQRSDALSSHGKGKAIELAEEKEILASGEARIEAMIGAGVIAELAADVPRMRESVVAGDARAAGGGKEQGGDNAQERGLACTVGSEEGDGLAFADLQGHLRQGGDAGFFKGLKEGAPTAARWREGLVERFDGNGG